MPRQASDRQIIVAIFFIIPPAALPFGGCHSRIDAAIAVESELVGERQSFRHYVDLGCEFVWNRAAAVERQLDEKGRPAFVGLGNLSYVCPGTACAKVRAFPGRANDLEPEVPRFGIRCMPELDFLRGSGRFDLDRAIVLDGPGEFRPVRVFQN